MAARSRRSVGAEHSDESRGDAGHRGVSSIVRLLVDGRWVGSYGIARFGAEVLRRLPWGYRRLTLGRPATLLDPVIAAAALAALRPDVYFTPGFCPPLGPTRVPCVVTIRDLIRLDEPAEASAAKSAFYAGIVRPGVRRAARVVTVSEHSRARIVEWAGIEADRVVVAPNGVSSAFTPGGERFDPPHDYLLLRGQQQAAQEPAHAAGGALPTRRRRAAPLPRGSRCRRRAAGGSRSRRRASRALRGCAARRRARPACTGARRPSCFPRASKASDCRCWRRMACGTPVVASSNPTRCARSQARQRNTSIRTIRRGSEGESDWCPDRFVASIWCDALSAANCKPGCGGVIARIECLRGEGELG